MFQIMPNVTAHGAKLQGIPHCSRNFILFISLPCCCPRPLRIACHEANAITVISIHHTRHG